MRPLNSILNVWSARKRNETNDEGKRTRTSGQFSSVELIQSLQAIPLKRQTNSLKTLNKWKCQTWTFHVKSTIFSSTKTKF